MPIKHHHIDLCWLKFPRLSTMRLGRLVPLGRWVSSMSIQTFSLASPSLPG